MVAVTSRGLGLSLCSRGLGLKFSSCGLDLGFGRGGGGAVVFCGIRDDAPQTGIVDIVGTRLGTSGDHESVVLKQMSSVNDPTGYRH